MLNQEKYVDLKNLKKKIISPEYLKAIENEIAGCMVLSSKESKQSLSKSSSDHKIVPTHS